ncbi:MAG: hypothetical protein Kow00129_03540 [Thermoleophilia bacterium]
MSSPQGVTGNIFLLFDFSRGRQALLSVAQPILGALLAARGLPSAPVVTLGLIAATAGSLSVFAANDLFDREADAKAWADGHGRNDSRYDLDIVSLPHPLAAGALSPRLAYGWVGGLAALALISAWAIRPLCALIFVLCAVLEFLYCRLKQRTWLKTLPAGLMVGLGGLAGWFAAGGPAAGAPALLILLAVWEVAGRNLPNDLADASADRPLGITTVATVFGPHVAGRWILAGSLLMPLLALLQPGSWTLRLVLAGAALWLMAIPALGLVRSADEAQAQAYFNVASFYPVAAAAGTAAVFLLRA